MLPVKKQLQLLVENSSLEISKDTLKPKSKNGEDSDPNDDDEDKIM